MTSHLFCCLLLLRSRALGLAHTRREGITKENESQETEIVRCYVRAFLPPGLFVTQLAYTNRKPSGAICNFGISESFEDRLNTLPHASCLFLGAEAEVPNFKLFITEEISDDISDRTEISWHDQQQHHTTADQIQDQMKN